jgi:hypothetical protein
VGGTRAASASDETVFGLDSSIYGNIHIRRHQARQLARAVAPLPAD